MLSTPIQQWWEIGIFKVSPQRLFLQAQSGTSYLISLRCTVMGPSPTAMSLCCHCLKLVLYVDSRKLTEVILQQPNRARAWVQVPEAWIQESWPYLSQIRRIWLCSSSCPSSSGTSLALLCHHSFWLLSPAFTWGPWVYDLNAVHEHLYFMRMRRCR